MILCLAVYKKGGLEKGGGNQRKKVCREVRWESDSVKCGRQSAGGLYQSIRIIYMAAMTWMIGHAGELVG